MLGNFILVMYVFFVWSTTHDYIKIYVNLYLRTYSWIYVQCTTTFFHFLFYICRDRYMYVSLTLLLVCAILLYFDCYFFTYCVRTGIKKVAIFFSASYVYTYR